MDKGVISGLKITLGEIHNQIINTEIKIMGLIRMEIRRINGDSRVINMEEIMVMGNSLLSQILMFQLSLIVVGVSKVVTDGGSRLMAGIRQIQIKVISNHLTNITNLLQFKAKIIGISLLQIRVQIHGINPQTINGGQIPKGSNLKVGINPQLFLLLFHLFHHLNQ